MELDSSSGQMLKARYKIGLAYPHLTRLTIYVNQWGVALVEYYSSPEHTSRPYYIENFDKFIFV
jgi:hypothetical protein